MPHVRMMQVLRIIRECKGTFGNTTITARSKTVHAIATAALKPALRICRTIGTPGTGPTIGVYATCRSPRIIVSDWTIITIGPTLPAPAQSDQSGFSAQSEQSYSPCHNQHGPHHRYNRHHRYNQHSQTDARSFLTIVLTSSINIIVTTVMALPVTIQSLQPAYR